MEEAPPAGDEGRRAAPAAHGRDARWVGYEVDSSSEPSDLQLHLYESDNCFSDNWNLVIGTLLAACAKKQLKKRGSKTLLGLASLFRQLDGQQDGQINRVELEKGLMDFHIDIPQEVLTEA